MSNVNVRRRLSMALIAASCLSCPSLVMAQEAEPELRVDFDLPSAGIGFVVDEPVPILPMTFGVWLTHRSGHGAMARLSSLALAFVSAVEGWFTGADGGEIAYQYSIDLAGDLRDGVTLAPYAGAFSGGSWRGAVAGPVAGVTATFRHHNFTWGADLNYHALIDIERPEGDSPIAVEHALTITARVGFGVY